MMSINVIMLKGNRRCKIVYSAAQPSLTVGIGVQLYLFPKKPGYTLSFCWPKSLKADYHDYLWGNGMSSGLNEAWGQCCNREIDVRVTNLSGLGAKQFSDDDLRAIGDGLRQLSEDLLTEMLLSIAEEIRKPSLI
jgi:hypothetical protein